MDYTKTKAGTRDVFLPAEARKLITMVRKQNLKNGVADPEHYLFINTKGERMHECSIDKKLYNF